MLYFPEKCVLYDVRKYHQNYFTVPTDYLVNHLPDNVLDVTIAFLDPENVESDILHDTFVHAVTKL